ncbi:MAG: hypothetical protein IPM06_19645 [Rhizobiales bacterium]|nr:hypothetical protein [Hyphomicrobiales bacterium]
MSEDEIRQMLANLEEGLTDLIQQEETIKASRLRQEGAILILRQVLGKIAVTKVTDGVKND